MSVFQSDMCSEFKRYATFNGFQTPTGVWPSQLAQAGFYRSGTCGDHQVICFTCGLQMDVRNLTRQPVMEVHRRLSPHCSFVTGASDNQPVPNVDSNAALEWLASNFSIGQLQTDSDNSPPQSYSLPPLPQDSGPERTSNSPSSLPFFPDGASLHNLPFLSDLSTLEQTQLDSLPMDFVDGFANAHLDSLSLFGGLSSSSQLFQPFTNNGLGGPREVLVTDGESVGMEGNYPQASMLQSNIADYMSTPAPPQQQTSLPQRQDDVGNSVPQKLSFDDLGIIIQRPKRQDMATYPKRLETFDRWQGQQISQTKEAIAEAGFYYAGYADCCRCFYCGGGLKSWESDDEPWIEHARWFTKCPYVRMSKGGDFIDAVLSLAKTNNSISMADVESEMQRIHNEQDLSTDVVDDVAADDEMDTDTELAGDDVEADALHFERENESLKQPEMCKICLDSEVSVLYVPCGHLVTCATCAPTVKTCIVCRQKIHGQVRVQRTD
ncbi:death-associated inhibitor of apoptosis 1-like [Littorina saxatilis]|uniref:RING-type domain-containing protein n=1 Tax=Littorina saxatilis TaxID=31220 RepID=A0AAN9GHL2_9CAEN